MLEVVPDADARDVAEQKHFDRYKTAGVRLFNLRPITKTNKGVKYSDESRLRLSLSAKNQFATKESREHHALAYRNGEPHRLLSPDGKLTEIPNMMEFCREHGLPFTTMGMVSKGKRFSCHGWTNPDAKSQDKKSNKLTYAQKDALCLRYQNGESTAILSAYFHITAPSVRGILQRRNIPIRKFNPKPKGCKTA